MKNKDILTFKAKIWKISNSSFGITIPKDFIESNLLGDGREYDFTIKEADSQ